jgi:hypothetical protein
VAIVTRERVVAWASVAASLWFALHAPALVVDDSGTYLHPALSWARGEGLRETDGRPLEYRLPLYPVLLGIWTRVAGAGAVGLTLLNLAAHATAMLLVRRVVARRDPRLSDVVFAAGLVYPPLLTSTALVLQESVVECALALVFVGADRALQAPSFRAATRAGAAIGLAALAKTTALAVALPLAALVGWHRRSWRIPAVLLAAVAIVVLPWALRNRVVLGRWEITNGNAGHAVLGGTVSNRIANWNTFPEYVDAQRRWAQAAEGERGPLDRFLLRTALARIVQHPAAWLRLCFERALRFMLPARTWAVQAGWSETGTFPAAYVALTVFHLALFASTAWLAVRAVRRRHAASWAAPIVVFTHQAVYALTYTSPRYAVTVGPVLFAGLALAWGKARLAEDQEGRRTEA